MVKLLSFFKYISLLFRIFRCYHRGSNVMQIQIVYLALMSKIRPVLPAKIPRGFFSSLPPANMISAPKKSSVGQGVCVCVRSDLY